MYKEWHHLLTSDAIRIHFQPLFIKRDPSNRVFRLLRKQRHSCKDQGGGKRREICIYVFPCLFLGLFKILFYVSPLSAFRDPYSAELVKCLLQVFQFLSPFLLALLDECHLDLVRCQLEESLTF